MERAFCCVNSYFATSTPQKNAIIFGKCIETEDYYTIKIDEKKRMIENVS